MVAQSVAGGPADTADINRFPETLLRGVETVTGGASAAYGSDAVTGVADFLPGSQIDRLMFLGDGTLSQSGGTVNSHEREGTGQGVLDTPGR